MKIDGSGMNINKIDIGAGVSIGNKNVNKQENNQTSANNAVTLDISEQGVQKSYEMQKQEWQEQAEDAKKSGDAVRDMAKMMEIARRISRGDHVPSKDEMALMEFSKELYMAAKSAAAINENKDPKDYGSVFDDEENDSDMRHKAEDLDNEADTSSTDTSTDNNEATESTSEVS